MFAAAAILLVELTAGDDRNPERREESRSDRTVPRVRILFPVSRRVAFDRELNGPPFAVVAPRHEETADHAIDAWQLSHPLHHIPILIGRWLLRYRWRGWSKRHRR